MTKRKDRESIEWTNTWWADANTNNRRGILIGDSTTRQLRGKVEKLLKNFYAVDLFASSFSLHDGRLEDYINLLFKNDEYRYDFLVLNYGGHHGFSRLCHENPKEYEAYRERYSGLVRYLLEKCKKIVCVTGTSEATGGDVKIIDEEVEREVVARNQIVADVARVYGLEVFDLHDLMKRNRKVYTHFDRWHFNVDSDYFTSYHLLQFMKERDIIDSKRIHEICECARERIFNAWGRKKKCIIYGTGTVGIELYWILKWYGMEDKISCFTVSQKTYKDNIFDKPIVPISDLTFEKNKNCIMIIASDKYRSEMYQTADQLQIETVMFYRDVIRILLEG